MSQDSRNLRIVAVIVVVLVVVGFIALWVSFRSAPVAQTPAGQTATSTFNPVAEIASNQLPAVFPPDIPMESGAAVTSNFNASAVNGQVQGTRSFQSVKSVDDNFALYQKFLKSNATTWTIISQVNDPADPNNKSIFAKNSGGLMTIGITALPPQPFPATLVTITYITNPPSATDLVATSTQP